MWKKLRIFCLIMVWACNVPKLSSFQQKQHCKTITHELLNDVTDDPELFNITPGDGTCLAITLKQRPYHPKEPVSEEPRPKSTKCEWLSRFFYFSSILGHTITKEYYTLKFYTVYTTYRKKNLSVLWVNNSLNLHHDNAQAQHFTTNL